MTALVLPELCQAMLNVPVCLRRLLAHCTPVVGIALFGALVC